MRQKIIELIFKISKQADAFDILENYFSNISKKQLSEIIIECGILPEIFAHDSSEEKLWAKYSDILLCKTLNFLGITSEVLRSRGNSADIFGRNKKYTIVGDAKTFRLSRTAKNQKDFKIKALDDWRKSDTYALLASPLYQYPNRQSQIYEQAVEKNVTLLSYIHLKFLLDFWNGQDLTKLWETGSKIKSSIKYSEHNNSTKYWQEIDFVVCEVLKKSTDQLKEYKKLDISSIKSIGEEGINYWKSKIAEYQKLSQKEAIEKLIKSEKIESKIKTIEKEINKNFTI